MLVKYNSKPFLDNIENFFNDSLSFPVLKTDFEKDFNVDISEDEKYIYLDAELPDVKKENVSVEVEGNSLLIKAERKEEKNIEGRNYYRKERVFGSLSRVFKLGKNLNTESIEAEHKDGTLKIVIPKSEKENRKAIEIK